jgi:hypothetical protein
MMADGGWQFPKFLHDGHPMMADGGQKVHQTSMMVIISFIIFPVIFKKKYI